MTQISSKMDSRGGNGRGSDDNGYDARSINRAHAYQPPRAATYANGDTQAEDIGASVIHRLTAAY